MRNSFWRHAHGAGLLLAVTAGSAPLHGQAATRPAPSWHERIELSGDFRPQFDLIAQDLGAGREAEDLRIRPRFRLRAGLTAKVSDRLTVGLRLASNEGTNPTSNNVALGRALAPRTMALDLAYVDWAVARGVRVTAGKFANPIVRSAAGARSQLLWDDDLMPEGLGQTITPVDRPKATVRRLAFHVQQWYLQEFAAETDSWMLGGQAVLDLAPRSLTTVTLAAGYYGFINGDRLARAANTNSQLQVSNSVILRDGTVRDEGALLLPSAANPFDRFATDFGLVHGVVSLARDRALGTAGLQLSGEAVVNTKADRERLGVQLAAGASGLLPNLGLTLSWIHVERDALLSMFSYSDLGRGGTNQEGWILTVQHRPMRGVTLALKEHYVRPILAASSSTPTHRLQLDATLAF